MNVDCKFGKDKVDICQYNHILADLDRLQGFEDYAFLTDDLVVFPLVEAVSFHEKMKLPRYDSDKVLNAILQFKAAKSLGGTNVYTQQQLRVLEKNCIVHGINCESKINKDKTEGFFHPTSLRLSLEMEGVELVNSVVSLCNREWCDR